MSCPCCPWGTCWCLRVQDTGQPQHPPIQDGLPWVMSGWDGRSTASSHSGPHSNTSRVPVPPVTSLRESRGDGGSYSFRAPFIQFVERERSLGPLHRGKLTPERTGAWRAHPLDLCQGRDILVNHPLKNKKRRQRQMEGKEGITTTYHHGQFQGISGFTNDLQNPSVINSQHHGFEPGPGHPSQKSQPSSLPAFAAPCSSAHRLYSFATPVFHLTIITCFSQENSLFKKKCIYLQERERTSTSKGWEQKEREKQDPC